MPRSTSNNPALKRAKAALLDRPVGGKVINNGGRADLREWGIGGDDTQPDFSGVQVTGNTDALSMLPTMVATLREKQRAAQQAMELAERAAADLSHFQMVVLPEAMELAGVAEFKLEDGAVLKVKPDLKAAIPKEDLERRTQCLEWLRAEGHGAIIKTFYDIDVRALTPRQRKSLDNMLAKRDLHPEVKEDVHWQTLKSLMKELLEKGIEPPPSFSIHQFKKAELKEPKAKE